MSGYGQIALKKIWRMLNACLPGYTKTAGKHKWIIRHDGREFLQLPLGDHHSRKSGRTVVERGVVRSLVRTFDIENCASEHLPQLQSKKAKGDEEDEG